MTIVLTPASLADCAFVWETNNHPTVRAVSLSSQEIPWEDHVRWYEQVLNDASRHLLIAKFEGANAGVIRFDLEGDSENVSGVVSVAVAPTLRGQGLGRSLIAQGTEHALTHWCDVVTAWIRPDNASSRRAFEHAGYRLVGEEVKEDINMLRLEAR